MPLLSEFEVQRQALLSLCFPPNSQSVFKNISFLTRENTREADYYLCPMFGPEMLALSTLIAHVREVFIDLLPFTTFKQ